MCNEHCVRCCSYCSRVMQKSSQFPIRNYDFLSFILLLLLSSFETHNFLAWPMWLLWAHERVVLREVLYVYQDEIHNELIFDHRNNAKCHYDLCFLYEAASLPSSLSYSPPPLFSISPPPLSSLSLDFSHHVLSNSFLPLHNYITSMHRVILCIQSKSLFVVFCYQNNGYCDYTTTGTGKNSSFI